MNKFLTTFADAVKANGLNIFRVAEYKDGTFEEAVYTETCASLNSYSISKVFVVTAIGMLYDDRLIATEDKVYDILAEFLPADALSDYSSLTVDDLLCHRIGLPGGYLDIDLYHMSEFGTDYLANVFTQRPVYVPGSGSKYTDAAYYVLSRIVDKVSGRSIEELLWERLFTPLGFREAAWSKCPQGHAMGATGLHMHTVDIAKLGVVYMNGGLWQGRRIISSEWVDIVLKRGYELKYTNGGISFGKSGMNGQRLMCVPGEGRAVAWQAFERCSSLTPLIDMVAEYKD